MHRTDLKNLIRQSIQEVLAEQPVEEMTTTGAVQGFMTPKAFKKKKLKEDGIEPYDSETDTVAQGPRERPEDWEKGGDTTLDSKQRKIDAELLRWVIKRLQREGNPNNRHALETVARMIKSQLGLK